MFLSKITYLAKKILFKKSTFNRLNNGFSEKSQLLSEFHLNIIGLAHELSNQTNNF